MLFRVFVYKYLMKVYFHALLPAWADPENSVRGSPTTSFFSHQHISQRAVQTSLEKLLDPLGPIASRERSVPVFLRKPIATCNFHGGVGGWWGVRIPCPPSGSAHCCLYAHY